MTGRNPFAIPHSSSLAPRKLQSQIDELRGNIENRLEEFKALLAVNAVGSSLNASKLFTRKVSLSHTQLQVAAVSNNLLVFTIPAKCRVLYSDLRPKTVFAGTTMTTYKASMGPTGVLAKYLPVTELLDSLVIADDTGFTNVNDDIPNWVSSTSVYLHVESDALLSASTAGSLDLLITYQQLP